MRTQSQADRLFSLPCFEGLRLLRQFNQLYPSLRTTELLNVIESVEADAHNLDMEASIELSGIVVPNSPLSGQEFYRNCIDAIIHQYCPNWLRQMRQGRTRFVNKLSPDQQDVFRAAGLLETPASSDVVAWWDSISGHARLLSDHPKIVQGRRAEILTLEFERNKLRKSGIDLEPEWPGLDDNFAGYDVLSYELGYTGVTNRLIEVKSTIVSPIRFSLTRNEWRTAEAAKDAYIFHIWNMRNNPPKLYVRTVSDVSPHIPLDRGRGQWFTTIVPLPNTDLPSNRLKS